MALASGVRLGPYTILAALGAGGMGEVYRAHDSRLGRDVAIKVLPGAFSEDPDRLRRFEQEARATAALNHPNILAVHDIGIEGKAPFIVSELLEGQTLREQLRAGGPPIPVRTAVGYAIAIARGLAAAHEKGVVHRDLKPDNLFITTDGRLKILDFGLAKLLDDGAAAGDPSALPTKSPHTAIGLVLGTVGYMSPEQVRGLPVDHRTDVFAFGAIVYEVLSGSRAFDRQTAPETLTAILNDHPDDLGSKHRAIPPALVHIVERCLEKKPSARFQTASDLAFALETLSDTTRSPTPPHAPDTASPARRRAWIGWAVAGLLLATLAPVAYQHVVEQPIAVEPIRFRIPPAVELAGPGNFSISPDGRHLAFFGLGSDGTARLWVRDMESLDVRSIAGSDVFGPAPPPFWSPDSRFIAFDAGGKLKKVEVSGGPAQTLCDLPGVGVGGTWNRNGEILVGNTAGGVLRVRETGGTVVPVTALDADRKEEFHLLPTFLPDGRHFVYLRISPSTPDLGGTYVGSIDAKPDEQSAQRLMPYAVGVTYAASKLSRVGLLLYVREGTLVGQPFDPDRLALIGGAMPIAERVGTFRDGAFFAASANDVLVYRTADSDSQVSWFDRQGVTAGRGSDPGGFRDAALSPDGTRAVASRTNPQDPSRADLWLLDLVRGGALRFTSGRGVAESPIWSPDGTRVVFTVDKSSIHEKPAGADEHEKEVLQSSSAGGAMPTGWSPDGRFLMYSLADFNTRNLWVSPLDGRKSVPFIRSEFVEDQGVFSPDGRWVAYISNQSGAYEVYVRGFTSDFSGGSAGVGNSTPISRRGGTSPRWRRDGRELFFLAADGRMMAVDIRPGPEFQAGIPAPLFQTAPGTVVGDVSADGRRFLLVNPVGPSASAPFTVVLNWTTGLKH